MITKLVVKNFTCLNDAEIEFSSKINIIIGENGTGKTHILKLLYAMAKTASCKLVKNAEMAILTGKLFSSIPAKMIMRNLCDVFHAKISDFVGNKQPKKGFSCKMYYNGIQGVESFINYEYPKHDGNNAFDLTLESTDNYKQMKHEPVFFPAREMLSIYPHFLELTNKYADLPYDQAFKDTMLKLGNIPAKKVSKCFMEIVEIIVDAIGGSIQKENDGFIMKMENDDNSISINMAAEGWRKFGMLMLLLRNGELKRGSVLLWDEPEANLNPKLIRIMCEVIMTLAKYGIQIFLTTHSLFVMREFEYLSEKEKINDYVRYICITENGIQQDNKATYISDIVSLNEEIMQGDRIRELYNSKH